MSNDNRYTQINTFDVAMQRSLKQMTIIAATHLAKLSAINTPFYITLLFLVLLLSPQNGHPQIKDYDTLYVSQDLSGHEIYPECNPGGASNCDCSSLDVAIMSNATYGTVISNVRQIHTNVNAVGYKKFMETFPNGDSISLAIYRYSAFIRLPVQPQPDTAQRQNPQAVHCMIQFWDGRNELFTANDTSYEGTIYWELNPWLQPKGKIKIYTDSMNILTLMETGLILNPDTLWHRFEITVDLVNRKYISIAIDSDSLSLDYPLGKVFHGDWGNDVSLTITTESLATWPQADCRHIFTWATHFKDLEFSRTPSIIDVNTNRTTLQTIALNQNYPNPFNPSTTIEFELPERQYTTLIIYNSLGQEVTKLVTGVLPAGVHKVVWNADQYPTGLYFYRLQAGAFVQTKKLLLMK